MHTKIIWKILPVWMGLWSLFLYPQGGRDDNMTDSYFIFRQPSGENELTYVNALIDRNEWIWNFRYDRQTQTGDFYLQKGGKKGRGAFSLYGSLSGGFTVPVVYLYLFDRSAYWLEGKAAVPVKDRFFLSLRFKIANFLDKPPDEEMSQGRDWVEIITTQTFSLMHQPYVIYGGGMGWRSRNFSFAVCLSGQKFFYGKPPAHQLVWEAAMSYLFSSKIVWMAELYKNFHREDDKQYLLAGTSYRFRKNFWLHTGLFFHDEPDPGSYWQVGGRLYVAPFLGIKWRIWNNP